MENQSCEITSTSLSANPSESEGSISPPRSVSPSMMDENPPREWDNNWRELELARPPSPWIQEMQQRQEEQNNNVQDDVPHLMQPEDDFVYIEGTNTTPHFQYIPPEQLQLPFPIFQSSYVSGSCPMWRTQSTNTSASLTTICEDCREVSVIIRQNNIHEIQLSLSELNSIFQCVQNNINHRR